MSPSVEAANELLRTLLQDHSGELIGLLMGCARELNKEFVVTITATPGNDEADVSMTIRKVEGN